MATQTIVTTGGTANLPATNELQVDMHKKRMNALVSLTPLTSITSRLAVNPAHNFRIDLTEEHEMPTMVTIAQTESSAGTTIYVEAYGTTLVADTLLYNPRTDDLRLVDSQPAANTVTVSISQGGTTSTVWNQGDEVHVLLPALAENDETQWRTASVANTNVYNLQQICKLQFALTRLENKMTTQFGGPGEARKQLKSQKYNEFRVKGEKLRVFGGRASSGTAPATKRMSNGIVRILKNGTHYTNFNGVFTETGFDNWIGDFADDNPDATSMTLFCAPNVRRQITYWGKDKVRLSPMSKTYGLRIDRYVADIDVDIVPMPILRDATTRGWMFLLDLSRIMLKDIDPPMYYPEALNVGQSENIYDTYREVTSMLVANESRHGMAVGATA